MSKVSIGYISYQSVTEPFMASMIGMVIEEERTTHHIEGILSVSGPYITENRNRIVDKFLELGTDWLLFIDTDMTFEPSLVKRLLSYSEGKNIVCGLYFNHFNQEGKVLPIWYQDDGKYRFNIVRDIKSEVMELSAAGTGCMMIHRDVFIEMQKRYSGPYPWFNMEVILDEKGKEKMAGEDITFCKRAVDTGFKIHGVFQPLGHVKTHIIDIDKFSPEQ